jgi:hypothetical protein
MAKRYSCAKRSSKNKRSRRGRGRGRGRTQRHRGGAMSPLNPQELQGKGTVYGLT